MSAASSRRKLIATWSPARGVWETEEVNLLCGHSALYSGTWPASGSMRSGRSFAHPTWELRTSGSGSSSLPGQLLPTPTTSEAKGPGDPEGNRNDTLRARIAKLPTPRARDFKGPGYEDTLPSAVKLLKTPTAQLAVNGGSQHPDKRRAGGHGPTLADEVEFLMPDGAGAKLLPTPKASDVDRGDCPSERARKSPMLKSVVNLLPTPRASDGTKGGPNQRGSKGDLMLPSAVAKMSNGAITRPRFGSGSASLGNEPPGQTTIEVA